MPPNGSCRNAIVSRRRPSYAGGTRAPCADGRLCPMAPMTSPYVSGRHTPVARTCRPDGLAKAEETGTGALIISIGHKKCARPLLPPRWLRRPAAEILGRTAFDLWPADQAHEEARDHKRALLGERVEREAPRARGPETRRVRVIRVPACAEDGGVRGVLGLLRDVTAETPDADRRLHGLGLVGRLAGGVVHDFNNLMTAVIGNAALLADALPPDGPEREMVAAIDQAAAHAAALTQRLSALLRHEPREPEPTDLNAIVEQTARLLRRTIDARIEIVVRPDAGLPPVEAVPTQILQLLLNLCLNARDAMPQGGRLELETALEVFDAERASRHPGRRPGVFVRLTVADNGEGMSPAVRARLFEPAFTTKPPGLGTGLGLSIVQSIAEEHRGWVECVSAPGKGSRFDVHLPFHADPAIQVDAEVAMRNAE